jgi:hypothetical protein
MAGKSRVIGGPALRRTLRRLPESTRESLADTLTLIGNRLLLRARAQTPVRTGGLRNALNYKVARKTLQLTLGLLTKGKRRDFFYGYILERGRRAQTVQVQRRKRVGGILRTSGRRKIKADITSTYNMKVRAIAPNRYDFVFGRRKDFVQNELPVMRQALIDGLQDAARG